MTTGRGFIALPSSCLRGGTRRAFWGRWSLAARRQNCAATSSADDSELLLMLPYVATIIVLIGVSRRAEFPTAFAVPYSRGDK
jgi:simple sugar transport system permease protein